MVLVVLAVLQTAPQEALQRLAHCYPPLVAVVAEISKVAVVVVQRQPVLKAVLVVLVVLVVAPCLKVVMQLPVGLLLVGLPVALELVAVLAGVVAVEAPLVVHQLTVALVGAHLLQA